MIYIVSSIYGVFFTIFLILDNKKKFIFSNKQFLLLENGKKIVLSRATSYFPFLVFLLGSFLLFSSFQYVDTTNMGRWGANDLPRYYFSFNEACKYSFYDFFLKTMQEPLYLLFVWSVRRISTSFTVFLIIIYFFHFCSLKRIVNDFNVPFTFFSIFSVYSLCFTTIIVSFCVLRMGIAVSWSYYFYIFLSQKKFKKSFITMLVAMGFHFSAIFLIFPLVLYWLFWNRSLQSVVCFFIVTFFIEFLLASLIQFLIPLVSSRYIAYINADNEAVAINTYFSSFLIVLLMLFQKQKFENMRNKLFFIIVLSILYILPLQRILSIFYRLIFFSYCGTSFALIEIVNVYKKGKDEFLYFCAVIFSTLYLLLFLNSFFSNALENYDLLNYSIFHFY